MKELTCRSAGNEWRAVAAVGTTSQRIGEALVMFDSIPVQIRRRETLEFLEKITKSQCRIPALLEPKWRLRPSLFLTVLLDKKSCGFTDIDLESVLIRPSGRWCEHWNKGLGLEPN